MLTSLALIFLVGLSFAEICRLLKLPRIIGMLLGGILIGPFVLDFLDPAILDISAELRKMALVIILIKAGLSLSFSDLKKVGRPAVLMSFLPALFEILAYVIFAPMVFNISRMEGALIGAVLGAVSPAVVVPKMVYLMDNKIGTDKQIPQLILAGASLDDVFVIVLFTAFVGMLQGNGFNAVSFINIPVSILLGAFGGALVGFLISKFFEFNFAHNNKIRNSTKVIILLGVSFLLLFTEDVLEKYVAFSSLLAVMGMAMIVAKKSDSYVTSRLKEKFGKIWIAAELLLFVLVGAAVDIRYTMKAGVGALLLIFAGLIIRSIGTFICLIGTKLNFKEKIFCVISYLPKATVQAAIGSVPLSLGLPCGSLVLSIAVLSILVTAPLGAILMDLTCHKLLKQEESIETSETL